MMIRGSIPLGINWPAHENSGSSNAVFNDTLLQTSSNDIVFNTDATQISSDRMVFNDAQTR